jgi:hypothetical protein
MSAASSNLAGEEGGACRTIVRGAAGGATGGNVTAVGRAGGELLEPLDLGRVLDRGADDAQLGARAERATVTHDGVQRGEGIVNASEGDARSMRSHTLAPAWSCRCKCGGSIAKSARNFPVSCRS